jgi:hypothetical protein
MFGYLSPCEVAALGGSSLAFVRWFGFVGCDCDGDFDILVPCAAGSAVDSTDHSGVV